LYAPPTWLATSYIRVVVIILYPQLLSGKAHLIKFQTEISHMSSMMMIYLQMG
jgi:hypothetical protein